MGPKLGYLSGDTFNNGVGEISPSNDRISVFYDRIGVGTFSPRGWVAISIIKFRY